MLARSLRVTVHSAIARLGCSASQLLGPERHCTLFVVFHEAAPNDQRRIARKRWPGPGSYNESSRLISAHQARGRWAIATARRASTGGAVQRPRGWGFRCLLRADPNPCKHAARLSAANLRLSAHGQRRITVREPPRRFVDEQVRGPYRRWHHEHLFESADGGTLCRDIVAYVVPGGWLIHTLFVRRTILRIFEFRQQKLQRQFGGQERAESGKKIRQERP